MSKGSRWAPRLRAMPLPHGWRRSSPGSHGCHRICRPACCKARICQSIRCSRRTSGTRCSGASGTAWSAASGSPARTTRHRAHRAGQTTAGVVLGLLASVSLVVGVYAGQQGRWQQLAWLAEPGVSGVGTHVRWSDHYRLRVHEQRCPWRDMDKRARPGRDKGAGSVCVPKTSSTSGDQVVFVDQASDASPSSDHRRSRTRRLQLADGLFDAFTTHRLVAVGIHLQESHDAVGVLLADPRLPDVVDDIVVELGPVTCGCVPCAQNGAVASPVPCRCPVSRLRSLR